MLDVARTCSSVRGDAASDAPRALAGAAACIALSLLVSTRAAADLHEVESFPVPTNARQLIYSPAARTLVLRNSASAIAVVDLDTHTATTRLAITQFTDMSMSPSGRYVFAADYGGENIGYGTPSGQSYVHRLDLVTKTWEIRKAYIAANVQAVSDTQLLLKSLDQWVSFTNNDWGSGSDLVPLNTPGGYWGPGYYAQAYFGDFRYDVRTSRLLHGNSNLSSQEIQAYRLIDDEFIRQEGSGTYGSAQDYGGSVVLSTDGSAFYYGRLQVDALDVTHNTRVFPEIVFAASRWIAFGNGVLYDTRTGTQTAALPFPSSVYALNPQGDDFWAYDSATTTVHHFAVGHPFYALTPCRLFDTRNAAGPDAAAPTLAAGESRVLQVLGRCGVPASARSVAVNLTVTGGTAPGSVTAVRGDLESEPVGVAVYFRAGQTRANSGLLELALDGSATVMVVNGSAGPVDVVLDVSGFFE